MRFFVGTSGYSYKEWKGSFYPENLPQKEMLAYYSQRFAAVEINQTFYQLPTKSSQESWAETVPDEFQFTLKAPRKITHIRRLKDAADETKRFLAATAALKKRRGPLLFQLPPNFKKDLARLKAFLRLVGSRTPGAFEFRHASWFDDDVFDCLRKKSCALCTADVDDSPPADLVATSGWGYIRLRRADYTDAVLRKWIKRLRSQPWDTAYVFFKHEETGSGPRLAGRFLELAGQ
ncbi:MAG TPA: DUF72 domain-containing protein [Planctomycetaceae bacterium]|nr:DUF72 domain-containing protein [Planctomycetaceae bacterium]